MGSISFSVARLYLRFLGKSTVSNQWDGEDDEDEDVVVELVLVFVVFGCIVRRASRINAKSGMGVATIRP